MLPFFLTLVRLWHSPQDYVKASCNWSETKQKKNYGIWLLLSRQNTFLRKKMMSWTEQQCCSTANLKTVEHFVEDLWKSLHAACSPAFMSLFCECLLFSVRVHPKLLSQNYSCEQQNSMPWLSLSSHLTLPATTPFSFWLLIYLLGTFIFLSPKSPHQCSRSPGTVPSLLPVREAGLGIHRAELTEGVEQEARLQPFTNLECVEKRMHNAAA